MANRLDARSWVFAALGPEEPWRGLPGAPRFIRAADRAAAVSGRALWLHNPCNEPDPRRYVLLALQEAYEEALQDEITDCNVARRAYIIEDKTGGKRSRN